MERTKFNQRKSPSTSNIIPEVDQGKSPSTSTLKSPSTSRKNNFNFNTKNNINISVCAETGDWIIRVPNQGAHHMAEVLGFNVNSSELIDNSQPFLDWLRGFDPNFQDLFLYLLLRIYLCWQHEVLPYPKKPKNVQPFPNQVKNQDAELSKKHTTVSAKRKPKPEGFSFLEQTPKKSGKQDIETRATAFTPLALQLSQIIQTSKNIHHTSHVLRQWAHEIRRLSELNKISIDRIQAVLDWYETNIGEEFIPVVESGSALRSKFLRLEDAMKRSQTPTAKRPRFILDDGIRYDLSKDGRYRDVSGNVYIP